MNITPISRNVSRHRQGTDLVEVFRAYNTSHCRVLRIVIHHDSSYHQQSEAKIESWDGDRWNGVHFLHAGSIKTHINANPKFDAIRDTDFSEDRAELIRVAAEILRLA